MTPQNKFIRSLFEHGVPDCGTEELALSTGIAELVTVSEPCSTDCACEWETDFESGETAECFRLVLGGEHD